MARVSAARARFYFTKPVALGHARAHVARIHRINLPLGDATFSPEPCAVLSPMQGTLRYRWRNATLGAKPCISPVKCGERSCKFGKTSKVKCRERCHALTLTLAHVASNR